MYELRVARAKPYFGGTLEYQAVADGLAGLVGGFERRQRETHPEGGHEQPERCPRSESRPAPGHSWAG